MQSVPSCQTRIKMVFAAGRLHTSVNPIGNTLRLTLTMLPRFLSGLSFLNSLTRGGRFKDAP